MKTLSIAVLWIAAESCLAITNYGARHIPIYGWRETNTDTYFDRNEYSNYRRNPIRFFENEKSSDTRQTSDTYFDRNGGREIRNTDDFPKPQQPWEEALRHSVYLTLVRDKIDSILVKNNESNRKIEVYEHTQGDNEIADVNLWRNIRRAQFKQNSKEKGPVFGDIAILSRGKLIETLQGLEFVEDENVKECIECHLYSARPNEVEAEKILTAPCDGVDCTNQRIKALWTVRRIRHRNPVGDDPPFIYELMFSIASPKPNGINLSYNEPSQTFSIKETAKDPKPKKHERKGKLLFLNGYPDNRGGYQTPQATITDKEHPAEVDNLPWYDGYKDPTRQQQSTQHPKYRNRYPQFYPEFQNDPQTQLNTGEKYVPARDKYQQKISQYTHSQTYGQEEPPEFLGNKRIVGTNSDSGEVSGPEFVQNYKQNKNYNIPTITHLHHHYYLNEKGIPVMKESIKYEKHDNHESYFPNMFREPTVTSNQQTHFTSNLGHVGEHGLGNISPQIEESPVTTPFFKIEIPPEQETLQYKAATISPITDVTKNNTKNKLFRGPMKFAESPQITHKRLLRPTKPFRPSPVDERIAFSELDPLYTPTVSTPTSYTTDAQIQIINLKNSPVEENSSTNEYEDSNFSQQYESNVNANTEETSKDNPKVEENPTEDTIYNYAQESTVKPDESAVNDYTDSKNEDSQPLKINLGFNKKKHHTEQIVTEKTTSTSEMGTTIDNIYVPEYSNSNEGSESTIYNSPDTKVEESDTFSTEALSTTTTTTTEKSERSNNGENSKLNSHRIERRPNIPIRRVKLQKKFSDLIKAQVSTPRSTATTVPIRSSTTTTMYQDKQDNSEYQSEVTQTPNTTNFVRNIRHRNTTTNYVPQRSSRRKYQRKLGTWSTNRLKPKLSVTTSTTESTTPLKDKESDSTTAGDDLTNIEIHNVTLYKDTDSENTFDNNSENANQTADSEINASIPIVATYNITEEFVTESVPDTTKLSNNTEIDITETNETIEPITMTEISETTVSSEEMESSPSEMHYTTIRETDLSSKPYASSDEEIFTPLTRKSFVTSISLKLGNKTRPYFQPSTEQPKNESYKFIDKLQLSENNTFMADLLSQFDVDDAIKAQISEIHGGGDQLKIDKAEDSSEGTEGQIDTMMINNVTKQIIEHA